MQLDWLEILNQIFEVAIVPLLAAATLYVITLVHKAKDDLLKKTENETAQKYINMLDKTITECVLATNQTYVNALKSQNAFDEEAQKHAFELTYRAVLDILTDEAKEYLGEVIKDLDKCITTKIEAQVVTVKNQPALTSEV